MLSLKKLCCASVPLDINKKYDGVNYLIWRGIFDKTSRYSFLCGHCGQEDCSCVYRAICNVVHYYFQEYAFQVFELHDFVVVYSQVDFTMRRSFRRITTNYRHVEFYLEYQLICHLLRHSEFRFFNWFVDALAECNEFLKMSVNHVMPSGSTCDMLSRQLRHFYDNFPFERSKARFYNIHLRIINEKYNYPHVYV